MRASTSSAGGTPRRLGIDGRGLLSRLSFAALCGALLAACSVFGPSDEHSRLSDAKARWNTHGYDDYQFAVYYHCGECTPGWSNVLRIRVAGGEIAEVFDVSAGRAIPQDYRTQTVPALFGRIREWLDQNPYRFSAEYHAAVGYPVSVGLDMDRAVADDVYGFSVLDLTPIPALPAGSP